MSRKRKRPPGIVIDVPIYGGKLVYVDSYKQWDRWEKHLTRKKPEKLRSGVGCSTAFRAPTSTFYMVGVFDPDSTILVHELAHIAFAILEDVEIPIGGDNEVYCYLLDTLYSEVRSRVKLK